MSDAAHDTPGAGPGAGKTIIVVGGGVAGVAAAVALADAGASVTLIEQRARLGGRASSVDDPKAGLTLDNGQHVVMRACTHLLHLYRRLNVADRVAWHDTLTFVDPQRPAVHHRLTADDLPAPLHLVRPLWNLGLLSVPQRVTVARGMLAVMHVPDSPKGRSRFHNMTFAEWLAEHGQNADVVALFWDPVVTSACNLPCDAVAADYALQVFQQGVLATDDAYEVGVPGGTLSDLLAPAVPILEHAGGRVLTGTTVASLALNGRRAAGVTLNSGETLTADAVIAALPFDRLATLCGPDAARLDDRLAKLDKLSHSPIVGVHLFFAEPLGRPLNVAPLLALPARPVHWLFNKGLVTFGGADAGTGRWTAHHLHATTSAAGAVIDQPADELAATAEREARRAIPALADAPLLHARVIKEKQATFALVPGVDAYRPTTRGAIDGLLLAGDWTLTGWPATMEGAARSGHAAGAAALDSEVAVDERQPSSLYRLLAG